MPKNQKKKSNPKKKQEKNEAERQDPNDVVQENEEKKNLGESVVEEATSNPVFDNDKLLKIVTVNVNSISAACKKGFLDYLKSENADVICIQETKLHSNSTPGFDSYIVDGYYGYFYNSEQHKGYAGTCIYTKIQPISIKPGFKDEEGRIILIEFKNFYIVNTYVPNAGQDLKRLDYKINTWNPKLKNLMDDLCKEKFAILCGDLNVAHQPIDIYDPKGKDKYAGYTPEERKWFDDFLKSGYTDVYRHLYPQKQQFSFFGYRFNMKAKGYGWRLDYFVIPTNSVDNEQIIDCLILNTNFSDHSPCVLVLNKDKMLTEEDKPVNEIGVTVLNSGAVFKKSDDEESEKKEDRDNEDNIETQNDQSSNVSNTKPKANTKSKSKKTTKKKK